jgi:TRAP transporter TAXI family solute receptor
MIGADPNLSRRVWLIGIAGVLAFAAVVASTYLLTRPMPLRIAVGPPGGADARLVAAIAAQLGRDRDAIRLRVIQKSGPADAAKALDAGEASLAVVRRDLAMPANGQAVAILRRNVVAVLALPNSGVEKVSDLAGHSIGVVGSAAQDQKVLGAILAQYEIPPDRVRIVPVELNEIAEAVRDKKFEALLVAGAVTGRSMSGAVAAMTVDGQPPKFVPISESEALSQRLPVYESTEIVAGAFGGVPPRPATNIETIGYSHYIVARSSLEDNTVGEFTRLLFGMRQSLAPEFPNIGRIEAPSTDKDAEVAVHAGAAAYFDGTQKNFFERYSDVLYIGVMLLSIVGSALAGFAGYAHGGNRAYQKSLLSQLLEMVKAAHRAENDQMLDELEAKADEILGSTLERAAENRISQTGLAAFTLAIEQARQAIAERRATLRAQPAQVESPGLWLRSSSLS